MYDGPERRRNRTIEDCPISDTIIEQVAERAAEKAFEKMYSAVGKGLLSRLTWILVAAVFGLVWWLGSKGIELKG